MPPTSMSRYCWDRFVLQKRRAAALCVSAGVSLFFAFFRGLLVPVSSETARASTPGLRWLSILANAHPQADANGAAAAAAATPAGAATGEAAAAGAPTAEGGEKKLSKVRQ